MIVEQYQLPCLSLSSYLVGDEATGEAVVIDPQRDISQYLAAAQEKDLTIGHVLLTHFHADYVSGHLELAEATGAEICFGEPAEADFPMHQLTDGERITLGNTAIEVWSTPGHTPESVTYLLFEHADDQAPAAIFTGDTLFVNDVGRPDLLGAIGFTADELGRKLYRSLGRLVELPDPVRVYPGHGAGSACGKALGSDPYTTIGDQKEHNYALQPMTEDEFVDLVTEGQPAAPAYFLHDAITNRSAHSVFDEAAEIPAMTLAAADVILAGDPGSEREARTRLGRIGFDRVAGYLPNYESALAAEPERAGQAERLPASDIGDRAPDDVLLLDVRNPGETADGSVPGARIIPLAALPQRLDELQPKARTLVYCAGGTRSSVAASFLRSRGFGDVADVVGGYDAWTALTGSRS